jgi:hypothetical protein
MSDPIRVGGEMVTCPRCGNLWHTSEDHDCPVAVPPDGAPTEPTLAGIRWCSLRDELEAVVADCVNADSPEVEERALDRATDRIFALLRARPSEPGTTAQ